MEVIVSLALNDVSPCCFSTCLSLAAEVSKKDEQNSHWWTLVGVIPCTEALCLFKIKMLGQEGVKGR